MKLSDIKIEAGKICVYNSYAIKEELKRKNFRFDAAKKCWYADYSQNKYNETSQFIKNMMLKPEAFEHLIDLNVSHMKCGKILSVKQIVESSSEEWEKWQLELTRFVNARMSEDNSSHVDVSVDGSQQGVWIDCFKFLHNAFQSIGKSYFDYELLFEYVTTKGTLQRTDVIILTENKVIILEFKKKNAVQIDNERNDYKELVEYLDIITNHHEVVKTKNMQVLKYFVLTKDDAESGMCNDIVVLNKNNFNEHISGDLQEQKPCTFVDEWINAGRKENIDQLCATVDAYVNGKIPYMEEVNKKCFDIITGLITNARNTGKKMLIFLGGVPGAGKSAVGQSIVYSQNTECRANGAEAKFLSGNGPLVEVLQTIIDYVAEDEGAGENVIMEMRAFKQLYFDGSGVINSALPEQSIFVFDEGQRAWDSKKMKRGFSEPEGLLRVGDKIHSNKGYSVVITLYGDGQQIGQGEEQGKEIWNDALKNHSDWEVYLPEQLSFLAREHSNKHVLINSEEGDKLYLSKSIRQNFVDVSPWVNSLIEDDKRDEAAIRKSLKDINDTSFRFLLTDDFEEVKRYAELMKPQGKNCGLVISNLADTNLEIIKQGEYANWFLFECNSLSKAANVYTVQGLELECPIVVWGNDFVFDKGKMKWIKEGSQYEQNKSRFSDIDNIIKNNYRVLLTRGRYNTIIYIPNDDSMKNTYEYFKDMGMVLLKDWFLEKYGLD